MFSRGLNLWIPTHTSCKSSLDASQISIYCIVFPFTDIQVQRIVRHTYSSVNTRRRKHGAIDRSVSAALPDLHCRLRNHAIRHRRNGGNSPLIKGTTRITPKLLNWHVMAQLSAMLEVPGLNYVAACFACGACDEAIVNPSPARGQTA